MGMIIDPSKSIMRLSSLNKGLVGYWPLDIESLQSATIFADKTPQENKGTSANAPVFTTDRMGQADRAMSFDGESDYIDCGNDESLKMSTNDFTIGLWVKQEADGVIFSTRRWDIGYYVSLNSSNMHIRMYSLAALNIANTFSAPVSVGDWHHLVWRVDRDVDVKVYVDGIYKDNVVLPMIGNLHNTLISAIGASFESDGDIEHPFNGSIADVRIYDYALSQQEITLRYEQYRPKISLGSLMKGLVLDMPLNSKRYNAGNSKFDDLTPYENRGVNTGGDVDTDHTTFIEANSDVVRIPDSVSLSPTSAMTAMIWVKGAAQNSRGAFSHWDNGVIQRSFLIYSDGNKLQIYISDNGSTSVGHYKSYRSSLTPFDSTWHLIGFTFDAGTLKLFVDDVEDTNPTKLHDDAITAIYDSTADIMLGCHLTSNTPSYFFTGDLARPKMWNRALTDAEWLLEYDKTKGLYL